MDETYRKDGNRLYLRKMRLFVCIFDSCMESILTEEISEIAFKCRYSIAKA